MMSPTTVPPTIEAIAARLDVAPAAVARALEATRLTASARLACDNPQSPLATGATLLSDVIADALIGEDDEAEVTIQ